MSSKTLPIWTHSSRVGTSTNVATRPSSDSLFTARLRFCLSSFWTSGSAKAPVLPLPVGASDQMESYPFSSI